MHFSPHLLLHVQLSRSSFFFFLKLFCIFSFPQLVYLSVCLSLSLFICLLFLQNEISQFIGNYSCKLCKIKIRKVLQFRPSRDLLEKKVKRTLPKGPFTTTMFLQHCAKCKFPHLFSLKKTFWQSFWNIILYFMYNTTFNQHC